MQLRAALERTLDVRDDAPLGDDEAAVRLERDLHRGGEAIRRETPLDLGPGQHFVPDVVLGARVKYALEDPVAALDDPRDEEELLVGLGLELAPQLVRATKQGT